MINFDSKPICSRLSFFHCCLSKQAPALQPITNDKLHSLGVYFNTWGLLKAQVNTENKEDRGASTNLCFNEIGHGIQNEEKSMGSKRIESNNKGQETDTDSDLSPI